MIRLTMQVYDRSFVRLRSFKEDDYYKELFSLRDEQSRQELKDFLKKPEYKVYITHAKDLMSSIPEDAIEDGQFCVLCPVTNEDLEAIFTTCEILLQFHK